MFSSVVCSASPLAASRRSLSRSALGDLRQVDRLVLEPQAHLLELLVAKRQVGARAAQRLELTNAERQQRRQHDRRQHRECGQHGGPLRPRPSPAREAQASAHVLTHLPVVAIATARCSVAVQITAPLRNTADADRLTLTHIGFKHVQTTALVSGRQSIYAVVP